MAKKKKSKKKMGKVVLAIVLVVGVFLGGLAAFSAYQMSLVPAMTVEEMLDYTTKNNENAAITIGIVKDGQMTYTVYGENGVAQPPQEHIYEIGSVTKTFTAALLCKALDEGKVKLDDPISEYLKLPPQDDYPTIRQLATHTAGYKNHYFNEQMISNFFSEQNDFYGIDEVAIVEKAGEIRLQNKEYEFRYSNFGMSVLGAVLCAVYESDYATLISDFIKSDLGLFNTMIGGQAGDMSGYWNWAPGDGYMPAGALTSTVGDMMQYIALQMNNKISYLALGQKTYATADASTNQYKKMNIHIDSVGLAWMIDSQNGFFWHNGGTSGFNSYVAFDPVRKVGVVVLSNLSPNYRISATVMGPKIMTQLQNGI